MPSQPGPSCHVFRTAAHDYFLGALAPAEERRLNEHVAVCQECAEFQGLCSELSCRELCETLNDYLEGTCSDRTREIVERHLAICPDCDAYLDSYRKTISLSALACSGTMPAEPVPERLVRAILEARRVDGSVEHPRG